MIIEEMTSPEFLRGLEQTRTVLVPIGATEQHGPHLPLGTDTFQAADVCRRLAEQRPVFVAPAISYGVCRSGGDHPGTIGISMATLQALVGEVVDGLYRQGLRDFVIISGHAGGTHNAALLDAGEAALTRLSEARIAVLSEYDLVTAATGDLVETSGDSHAGEIETSRMLASRPEMVKGGAKPETPGFPRHILVRNKPRYWSNGVWGDPGRASAAKGRQIEERVTAALDRLVTELESFRE